MSDVVLLNEHRLEQELVLAEATLNVPATLNSLSLEMVRMLAPKLAEWRERPDVVAVVITGSGDRAFCAGGDIQALYHAIVANHEAAEIVNDYPFKFFKEEYELDFALHTFPKPVVTLGNGVVMGGGLGVFSGSSHRVVTETSRLAVPEITIGLFPDAGGTWGLGRMQQHWASFLGMTGSHVNAADALLTGMATHSVAQAGKESFVSSLCQLPFQGDPQADGNMLNEWLADQPQAQLPESEMAKLPEWQVDVADLSSEVANLQALAGKSKWIDRGLANLASGCPTTAGIVLEQLRRVPDLTLADSFRLELTVGTHCANNRDFREGVRALLIDKDNSPNWQYGSIESLDWAHVLSHFDDPWPEHPLKNLG